AGAEATIGLLLFYLHQSTSLVDSASGYIGRSDAYTRVGAGFYSPGLLGSFCIFASAVLALPDGGLSQRTRRAAQCVLAVLVVATLSRAVIGFALGAAIRIGHARGTLNARRF